MNDIELDLYKKILKRMNKNKQQNPSLYNNDKIQYIKKSEVNISNDATKGVILSKLNKNYIIEVFVDCGFTDIITNIIREETPNEVLAEEIFERLNEFVLSNNTETILKSAKF